ncbi:MAG: phosphatidylglycerol lysyltransferase domain-containing protein [Oscillospiraceae bacterium]|nr:phosphatidylglycerol lysyltransferase domain-containing protein [Oscillospiraceae bacterium]
MSLSFHIPDFNDRLPVFEAASAVHAKENDAAFASIYLLREKYGTEICFQNSVLLRRYQKGIRKECYGYPIGLCDCREMIQLLKQDADERGQKFRLTMLTEQQCSALQAAFPDRFQITKAETYTEYLYLQSNLSELKGSKYHSKRNHISQFRRMYPDAFIQPLVSENAEYAVNIAKQWLMARPDPEEASLQYEWRCICEAASQFDALGLSGLLLYADALHPPIGMTIVSRITEEVADIHFEKVVPDYPHAWPVVANEMARCLHDVTYLNREEDLGESGMRSSKKSYAPDLLNEKYIAEWKDEKEMI